MSGLLSKHCTNFANKHTFTDDKMEEESDENRGKTLQLRRALSGGFGFSLMGGKGTNFPPVICDILSDSPASKCKSDQDKQEDLNECMQVWSQAEDLPHQFFSSYVSGQPVINMDTLYHEQNGTYMFRAAMALLEMQVGDIILEINGESVQGKTTKEDTETRERVIKFLEPLENPPGVNQKTQVKTPSPEKSKTPNGTTTKSLDKMPGKSVVENGPDSKEVNHTDLSPPGSDTTKSDEPMSTRQIGEMLNSNNKNTQVHNKSVHLQIPEKNNSSVDNHKEQEHPGVTSPTSKRGGVINSRSFSSDSSLGDVPTGQVLTTVAQVHREDSTLIGSGATSPATNSEKSLGVSVSTNGNNTPSDTTVEEVSVSTPTNLAPCARLAETILENESTGSELSQLSETSDHTVQEQLLNRGSNASTPSKDRPVSFPGEHAEQEWQQTRTVVESSGKEIQVNRTDSGYASASSVAKSNIVNHVQSQSTQTYEETLAETTVESQQLPYADEGESLDANSLSGQPDVLEGVEGATQSPRPSLASSTGSDESEVLDMDRLENALMSNSKNLDVPSAKRLAKRLYTLDGFKKSDVAKHLSKRNDFSKLVAEEYLGNFSFHGLRIDQALRKFLSSVAISGESQERERVLAHFSRRFHQSNPELYRSDDAVQILTCAIMLLNTDLHGQNIGKKMTVNGFINNLEGTNDGDNFPKETLKALYQSIKSKPLEWATDGEEVPREEGPQQKPGNGTTTLSGNPFIEVQNDPNAPVYIKGYIMRKCISEPDGRKTARGKRGWKMYYATLKGLILYLHKSSISQWSDLKQESEISHQMHFNTPKEALSLHHSLAARVPDYSKRPHVFSLRLASWKEYLIQCLDTQDLQNWMQAFNLASAVHSSPPLPAPVGSQKGFKRPLLPSSSSKLNLTEQLTTHDNKVDNIEHELEEHRNYPPEKGARATLVKDYRAKQDFLEYELTRFKVYVYLLHSQPTMPIGKFSLDEVMPQSGANKPTLGTPPSTGTEGDSQGQAKAMFNFVEDDTDSNSLNSTLSLYSEDDDDDDDDDKSSEEDNEDTFTFILLDKRNDDAPSPVPRIRAEERITDEKKPTHTYWEILDDDEKTDCEILEQEFAAASQVQHTEGIGNENNNQSGHLFHELPNNEMDEDSFL